MRQRVVPVELDGSAKGSLRVLPGPFASADHRKRGVGLGQLWIELKGFLAGGFRPRLRFLMRQNQVTIHRKERVGNARVRERVLGIYRNGLFEIPQRGPRFAAVERIAAPKIELKGFEILPVG